jgi:exopolyphosphatase/guanosine-5'-triphosphate,3'-diphosphate pyrophosphatase
VLIHRSRTGESTPDLRLRVQGRSLRLEAPAGWLASNPLTLADLERERKFLAEADYKLTIQRRSA